MKTRTASPAAPIEEFKHDFPPLHETRLDASTVKLFPTHIDHRWVPVQTDKGVSLIKLNSCITITLFEPHSDISSTFIKDVFCLQAGRMILVYHNPATKKTALIHARLLTDCHPLKCEISPEKTELDGDYQRGTLSPDKKHLLIFQDRKPHLFFTHDMSQVPLSGIREYLNLFFLSSSLLGNMFENSHMPIIYAFRIEDLKKAIDRSRLVTDHFGEIYLPIVPYCVFGSNNIHVSPNGQWMARHFHDFRESDPQARIATKSTILVRSFRYLDREEREIDGEIKYLSGEKTLCDPIHVQPESPDTLTWLADNTLIFEGGDTAKTISYFNPESNSRGTICGIDVSGFTIIHNNVLVGQNNPARLSLFQGPMLLDRLLSNISTSMPSYTPASISMLITQYVETIGHITVEEQAIETRCLLDRKPSDHREYPRHDRTRTDRWHEAARSVPLIGRLFAHPSAYEKTCTKTYKAKIFAHELITIISHKEETQTYRQCIEQALITHNITLENCNIDTQRMIAEFFKKDSEVAQVRFIRTPSRG